MGWDLIPARPLDRSGTGPPLVRSCSLTRTPPCPPRRTGPARGGRAGGRGLRVRVVRLPSRLTCATTGGVSRRRGCGGMEYGYREDGGLPLVQGCCGARRKPDREGPRRGQIAGEDSKGGAPCRNRPTALPRSTESDECRWISPLTSSLPSFPLVSAHGGVATGGGCSAPISPDGGLGRMAAQQMNRTSFLHPSG